MANARILPSLIFIYLIDINKEIEMMIWIMRPYENYDLNNEFNIWIFRQILIYGCNIHFLRHKFTRLKRSILTVERKR